MEKREITAMTYDELAAFCKTAGVPSFRAGQIFGWLHQKKVGSFSEMTNLPAQFRDKLNDNYYITSLKIRKKLVSALDDTVKYLYELPDGCCVETVFMRYHHGNSLCISTQVGCKMGCRFCASTIAGFVRNLSAGELLAQITETERDLSLPVDSIVLMGIGEPLDNYDEVVRFLRILSDPRGRGMSLRHLSLSTCGLVDRIDRLAEEAFGLTLSVSLHAPDDETRSEIMPVNRRYPLSELLAACRRYTEKTHRRISFEYALIDGVNDDKKDAEKLAALLHGMLCHVNLIPVNPVAERDYKKSNREKLAAFQAVLQKHGIETTIRRTLGADINAACGQLRRSETAKEANVTCNLPEKVT